MNRVISRMVPAVEGLGMLIHPMSVLLPPTAHAKSDWPVGVEAVKVAGGRPATWAVSWVAPAPSVQESIRASPPASVCAPEPTTGTAPFAAEGGAQVPAAPPTGLPKESVTLTRGGSATAAPSNPFP